MSKARGTRNVRPLKKQVQSRNQRGARGTRPLIKSWPPWLAWGGIWKISKVKIFPKNTLVHIKNSQASGALPLWALILIHCIQICNYFEQV